MPRSSGFRKDRPITDITATALTVTRRSSVTEDQIDHLGHMNVRFYGVNAQAGTTSAARPAGRSRRPDPPPRRRLHAPPPRAAPRGSTDGPQWGDRRRRRRALLVPRARERGHGRSGRHVRPPREGRGRCGSAGPVARRGRGPRSGGGRRGAGAGSDPQHLARHRPGRERPRPPRGARPRPSRCARSVP